MEHQIGSILKTAGFLYHELAVIERIRSYLTQANVSAVTLGRNLFLLHQAAKEWAHTNNDDKECNLFLTLLSFDRNSLCVVTQLGEPVAWLNLCTPSLCVPLFTADTDRLER